MRVGVGPQFQKYTGRVVLGGDIVKDSGSQAVFTEQSPSATQMTAAEVMDVIARIPGFAGQAADAAENAKVRMSRYFGFAYHDTIGPNHGTA